MNLLKGLTAILSLALSVCTTCPAATLEVQNTNAFGDGSLRFLIQNATSGDTIVFAPAVTGRISLQANLVVPDKTLTVIGPGAHRLTLDGGGTFRILNVFGTSSVVRISGLTFLNGAGGDGGAIRNEGSLELRDCLIQGNTASGSGGGIYTASNSALRLIRCTLASNRANFGGGLFNYLGAKVALTNCTIVANTASGEGGGIMSDGDFTAISCTVANNSCTNFAGGGIHMAGGYGYLGNCVVAGNKSPAGSPDVSLSFFSLHYNYIGITNGSIWYFGASYDRYGTATSPLNPLLGPLVRSGGATVPTLSPRPGSPLIDQGHSLGLNTDQRGLPRPVDFDAVGNALDGDGADIGAVEVAPPSNNIYEWTFDSGDLSATLGTGTLQYADAATPGLTTFGLTDGATLPQMNGEPASYMHVPAFTGLTNGYLMSLNASGPNGGGTYINQYTLIADVLVPNGINWTPFFNTNPLNQNDADFYVAPNGSIGIGSVYSAGGVISANTWYRIAFVAELSSGTLTYYVNGTQVREGSPGVTFDGRWSLLSNLDPGADLLLFNEGDTSGTYTHEIYVAGIAFVDRNLAATEIAALGGPAAEGIFVRRLRIARTGGQVSLSWRGAPDLVLQKATNLQMPDWQTIPETLGASAFLDNSIGTANAFYRLAPN